MSVGSAETYPRQLRSPLAEKHRVLNHIIKWAVLMSQLNDFPGCTSGCGAVRALYVWGTYGKRNASQHAKLALTNRARFSTARILSMASIRRPDAANDSASGMVASSVSSYFSLRVPEKPESSLLSEAIAALRCEPFRMAAAFWQTNCVCLLWSIWHVKVSKLPVACHAPSFLSGGWRGMRAPLHSTAVQGDVQQIRTIFSCRFLILEWLHARKLCLSWALKYNAVWREFVLKLAYSIQRQNNHKAAHLVPNALLD